MKTIKELVGTFKVGQHYEIELSPYDSYYEKLDTPKFSGEVVDIDKRCYFMGTPYFSSCDNNYCWFMPNFTKVKLIEDKNERNR